MLRNVAVALQLLTAPVLGEPLEELCTREMDGHSGALLERIQSVASLLSGKVA